MKKFFFTFTFILFSFLFFSCTNKTNTIVIWTDRAEIVSYVELFNVEHENVKAIVVYKEQIATSLPPAKDEMNPDIVIGSLLNNSKMKKHFISLNGIMGTKNKKGEISNKKIDRDIFYKSLIDYGKMEDTQYLLPVSFNLPIMIFSNENKNLIKNPHIIELDDIKESSANFNEKTKKDIYSKMGFAPSWNAQFIYTVAKMNNVDFHEVDNTFVWNEYSLKNTIDYIKKWTSEKNTETSSEQDFSFKYLYMPSYKQISSSRCLFAYSTTNEFFSLAPEQIDNTDFRWLTKNNSIFAEDDITTAGIFSESKHKSDSKVFLRWFINEENQRKLIDRSFKMDLGIKTFGICNGFSSIKAVNEQYFPIYYKNLLGNLPGEDLIQSPFALPPRWTSLRERVLVPYLTEITNTENKKEIKTIEERLITWSKQFN